MTIRWGCHRPRIADGIVFDELVELLVFSVGTERVACRGCSAATMRRRRDKWRWASGPPFPATAAADVGCYGERSRYWDWLIAAGRRNHLGRHSGEFGRQHRLPLRQCRPCRYGRWPASESGDPQMVADQ